MNCNRGDVALVLFPDSNLRTVKRRPALVVQSNSLATGLPQTIVALITSNMARAGHPCRVEVRAGTALSTAMGLRTDSVIVTDNLATVLDVDIVRTIGAVGDMILVDNALRRTLSL